MHRIETHISYPIFIFKLQLPTFGEKNRFGANQSIFKHLKM